MFMTDEDANSIYTALLVDENDLPISGGDLDSITVTLYNEADGAIINTRNQSSTGLTVASDGQLTWQMDPEDNPIIDDTLFQEKHRALFEFSWQSGNKNGEHEVSIWVRNFGKV